MTEKQLRFIGEYLSRGDEIAACRSAYPHLKSEAALRAQAARLMQSEEVRRQLDVPQPRAAGPPAAAQGGRVADAQEVMEYLTAVMRGETQSDGGAKGPRSPDEKERLRAAELLGKCYNIFSDAPVHQGPAPVIVDDVRFAYAQARTETDGGGGHAE